MHHPPDLNLASSYIPACLCILKSAMAFVLFILSPLHGWIGMGCLVLVDRDLWNNSQTHILDVNSVVASLIGGLMVVRARSEGFHTALHFAVLGAWALGSIPQITGITRLPRSFEVIMAGACVALLSCMHQAQERTEVLALRAFVFMVMNIMLPYVGIALQQHDVDTHLNICRTLLILLGDLEAAGAWVAVYVLCLGNQIRTASHSGHQCKYYEGDDEPKAPPMISVPDTASPDDISSQLRKALAIKKELYRDA